MTRSEQKRAVWVRHIRAWLTSGQSRSAYCAANGINVHTLDYWRRREAVVERPKKRLPRRTSTSMTLIPVTVTPSVQAQPSVDVHSGTVRVCVPVDMAASWVAELVRGLLAC